MEQKPKIDIILYNVKDVALLFKTNVDYIHRLRKAGILRFIKLGQYKIRKETLEKFLIDYEGYDLTNPLNIKTIDT